MNSEHPSQGFSGLDLNSQLWLQSHLDVMRRDYESRMLRSLNALLEATDNAQRLCQDPSFGELSNSWRDGLNALYKKLLHHLGELGVTRIETLGLKVDPSLHHVIAVVAGVGQPETIVHEEQAGYLWNDQVLRIARVTSVASTNE